MTSKHLPAMWMPQAPAAVTPRSLAPALAAEEAGPDWRRIARALWRFKWVVFLSSVLGTAAGVAAVRALKPVYVAQATVWIDVPDNRREPDRAGPIRPGGLLASDAWIDLLRSYVVLDHVVRELRLYLELKSPDDTARFNGFGVTDTFRPGDYVLKVDDDGRTYVLSVLDGAELERGVVGDSIGARLGFRWVPTAALLPPGGTVQFTLATPRDAALRLGERLDVRMDLNGNFLSVELRGTSPRGIANILNATTARFVHVAGQLKREKLTELTKILEDQRGYAQRSLDEAETALKTFRMRTITLPSDQPAGPAAAGGAGGGGTDARPGRQRFLRAAAAAGADAARPRRHRACPRAGGRLDVPGRRISRDRVRAAVPRVVERPERAERQAGAAAHLPVPLLGRVSVGETPHRRDRRAGTAHHPGACAGARRAARAA